jgi:hypothetical protein
MQKRQYSYDNYDLPQTADAGSLIAAHVLVPIDGHLSGDYVEAVELCCEQAVLGDKPIHLLLRDVSTIDQAGRALLRRLSAKGIRMLASGVYASNLVHRSAEPLVGH